MRSLFSEHQLNHRKQAMEQIVDVIHIDDGDLVAFRVPVEMAIAANFLSCRSSKMNVRSGETCGPGLQRELPFASARFQEVQWLPSTSQTSHRPCTHASAHVRSGWCRSGGCWQPHNVQHIRANQPHRDCWIAGFDLK